MKGTVLSRVGVVTAIAGPLLAEPGTRLWFDTPPIQKERTARTQVIGGIPARGNDSGWPISSLYVASPEKRVPWGPKSILYRQDSLCNFTVPLFERTAAYSCIALTRMTTKQNECNSFCAGLGSVADRITALLIDYKV